MRNNSRFSGLGSFWLFGLGLAVSLWGLEGLIEFWILARISALSQLKFLAFLSETCFYYSLTGAGLFLLFGLAAVAAASPRRTWLEHFKKFQLVIAAGIIIGQELYFSRLASLLPPSGRALDSKLLLQNALWLSYCMFLFAALIFLAWALEKRLSAKPRLLILKGIYLALAAVFLLNLAFYPLARPWRWLEGTGEFHRLGPGPNVILITLDALRPDRLAAYGYTKIETPNISRVAAEGVVFENAFSQANWTFPSVVALFTSRYPDAVYPCQPYLTGFEPDYKTLVKEPVPVDLLEKMIRALGPDHLTLAKVLYSYGYRTGAVVSNWLNCSILGIAQGFENFSAAEEMVSRFGPIKRLFIYQLELPDLISLYARVYALYLHHTVKMDPDSSIYINQRAEKFLAKNSHHKFFLWLHYMETHSPFGDAWEPPPPPLPDYHGPLKPGFRDIFPVAAGEISLDAEDIRYLSYLYDYDLAYADSQLGNLFRFLQQNHLWENTVIIISADHGEQLMEHGRLGHGFNLYSEDLWVPLIIKPAGKISPRRVREPVQLLDLAPTILDLAGIPIPKSFVGRSLKPLLEGKDGAGDSFIYGACNLLGEPTFSLRQNGWLLVYYSVTGRAELYDLARDPGNHDDLAGKFPDLARQMLAQLKAAMQAHAAEREQNQTGSSRVKLKPEDVQRLRALGYVK